MNILMLTQVLPYPTDSGPKVKTLNVIKYLAQHHEVTLISFVRGDQSADAEQLRAYCRTVHCVPMQRTAMADGMALLRSVINGQPWLILRDDRAAMHAKVAEVLQAEKFDVIHADQHNMAQFAPRAAGVRRVLDTHNALWLLYQRMADTTEMGLTKFLYRRDWKLLKRYEGQVCREFDAVLAVSEEDKAALVQAGAPAEKITVLPITVDSDAFAPVQPDADAQNIIHLGTMYWQPNVDGVLWFLREVWPLIRAQKPDAHCDICGARPPESVRALGGAGSGVNVTGYVADPAPYLQKAGVMIVPVRAGGGMRVKILNNMSMCLPIVSTTIGSEGIAVEHEKHLLIADTSADYAAAVLRLLDDRALARRLGENGRALVLERYDYRAACRVLEDVYRGGG